MDRVKLPMLDQDDRRVIGLGLVIAALVFLVFLAVAVTAGLALRVFWLAAGL